jgi:hypothetical protein
MKLFQFFLIILSLLISIITFQVISKFGINIIPLFFGEIISMTWQGQFNFDFLCFLLLASLWLSWRKNFSFTGVLLGVITSILGIFFLAPYLLYETIRLKGNSIDLVLGDRKRN